MIKRCGYDIDGKKIQEEEIEGCGKEYEPNLANDRENALSRYCPECVKKILTRYEKAKRELDKQHPPDEVRIWWTNDKFLGKL